VYPHWRGRFYPCDLPPQEWLGFYAERFDSVEINNTFYQLPEARTFDVWRDEVPEDFCFALKFSRYGSHQRKLREPAATIGRFLERADRLGSRLGPILVQLPPRWRADPDRLAGFLDAVPSGYRFAFEFRDESWLCPAVYELLRERGAALCIHDLVEGHPRELTARFTYLRFHGAGYAGSYPPQALAAQARRIRGWRRAGRDVYAYFNNDAQAFAVRNAADLRRYTSRPGRGGTPR
jgi:uncharacterized protein YecE (DUF72 family)